MQTSYEQCGYKVKTCNTTKKRTHTSVVEVAHENLLQIGGSAAELEVELVELESMVAPIKRKNYVPFT